jgi:hypothetical protein
MNRQKTLLPSITSDHIHIFEGFLLDAYSHVSHDILSGKFEAEGVSLENSTVWVDFIGLAIIDALYQTALSDPNSDLQFGMGSRPFSRESHKLRESVAKGITLLNNEKQRNKMAAETALHAKLIWQNWGKDEPASLFASELLAHILLYLSTLEQQQKNPKAQPEFSAKVLMEEVDEHSSYHPFLQSGGEPNNLHQPFILGYPIQGHDRFLPWVEGSSFPVIPVEVRDPRIGLSWMGHAMVLVTITHPGEKVFWRQRQRGQDLQPNRWRLGPLSSWFNKFGEDCMKWPDPIDAQLSDSGVLIAKKCQTIAVPAQ